MQEKSELNFLFNTQMQEKSGESGCCFGGNPFSYFVFGVILAKGWVGDILQSDMSHLQFNTLLNSFRHQNTYLGNLNFV